MSNICLGTMNFGWQTTEEESFGIMDRALELGINFFDTADVYGWGGEQGDTEETAVNAGHGGESSGTVVGITSIHCRPARQRGWQEV